MNVVRVDESENMHIEETKLWGGKAVAALIHNLFAIYII